jgi:hypothetical protein
MSPGRFLSPLPLLLASTALSGCSYFSTLDDCGDLAATVNPPLLWVAQQQELRAPNPAMYRTMAAKYAEAGSLLGDKRYASVELTPLVIDYGKLLSETATNMVVYAGAVEQNDPRSQKVAIQTSRQHATRQRHFVRRIESLCRGN